MRSDVSIDKSDVFHFQFIDTLFHDYQDVQVASFYNCFLSEFFSRNDAIGQEMEDQIDHLDVFTAGIDLLPNEIIQLRENDTFI